MHIYLYTHMSLLPISNTQKCVHPCRRGGTCIIEFRKLIFSQETLLFCRKTNTKQFSLMRNHTQDNEQCGGQCLYQFLIPSICFHKRKGSLGVFVLQWKLKT